MSSILFDNVSGIYKITNIITLEFYIGSAKNLSARKAIHISLLSRNKHGNVHLQRAVNKYGMENFKFEVLIVCNPRMLIFYEQRFLDYLKPVYNINKKADSRLGTKQSQRAIEAVRKTGLAQKGVPKPASYSEKLSKRMMGNTLNKGRKRTEETRIKMSLILKGNKHFLGKKHSEEWKERARKWMKEYWKQRREVNHEYLI